MYYTLKWKICGGNDEINVTGIDQYKYSKSSAKCRRTIICKISIQQNLDDKNQSEIKLDKTNDDHELTNFGTCSKNNITSNMVTSL